MIVESSDLSFLNSVEAHEVIWERRDGKWVPVEIVRVVVK